MAVDVGSPSDPRLASIPFGRSRLIAALAAVTFDLALRTLTPTRADAHVKPPAYPCNTALPECHSCCPSCPNSISSCWTGTSCWYVCTDCDHMYRCCDYLENPHGEEQGCTCSQFWGSCTQIC
jgi:hypothetical protein